MANLRHWDSASTFTGRDVSLLMMGVDPASPESSRFNSQHLLERIRNAYLAALHHAQFALSIEMGMECEETEPVGLMPIGKTIHSVDLSLAYEGWRDEGLEEQFVGWLQHERSAFEFQKFSRSEVVKWIEANDLFSEYEFDSRNADSEALGNPEPTLQTEIDPGDLPFELDVGRIAFRTVTNGYGSKTATFRNRLIEYLKVHYPKLKYEAVKRIATVANPDKTTGRKKSDKE